MHRAETIMAAVVTAVTGLTTTGANVFRDRAYDLQEGELPGLVVSRGEEEVRSVLSHDQQICALPVEIDIRLAEKVTEADTLADQIRAEITVALAADYTLGLSFVYGIAERASASPTLGGEADRPSLGRRLTWLVTYRRSRTNPAS